MAFCCLKILSDFFDSRQPKLNRCSQGLPPEGVSGMVEHLLNLGLASRSVKFLEVIVVVKHHRDPEM